MLMEVRLFHKGAYKNALHRLSFPVIAITALLVLAEIAYLVHLNQTARREIYQISDFLHQLYPMYSFVRLSYPMIFVFLVISPGLMIYLFAWQNRRAGSDSIHALSITRKSFAVTNALAVLTMDAVVLLFGGLLLEGLSAVLPYVRMCDENSFFLTLGCYMAGAVFTTALVLLALSLSGTRLSTICMYVILLVVPRLMLVIWELNVFRNSSTFDTELRGTLLDVQLNIVTGLMRGHIDTTDYVALKSLPSLVYTLIVGLMIGVLAIHLYAKRPAETAGHPAVSERVHGFFRIVLGCAICLIPLTLLWNRVFDRRWIDAANLSEIFAIFAFAVVVYMIYELIHSRSLHCCITALPGLLYVLVFCVIFSGLVWYGKQSVENDYVRTEQVKSISLTYQPGYYSFSEQDDYYCCAMRDYKIIDREVIGILCEAVNREMRCENQDQDYVQMRLVINGGVLFRHREVSIPQSDMRRIFVMLGKDSAYRDIFLKPVEKERIQSFDISAHLKYYSIGKDHPDFDKLYQRYCDSFPAYSRYDFSIAVDDLVRRNPFDGATVVEFRDGTKQLSPGSKNEIQ